MTYLNSAPRSQLLLSVINTDGTINLRKGGGSTEDTSDQSEGNDMKGKSSKDDSKEKEEKDHGQEKDDEQERDELEPKDGQNKDNDKKAKDSKIPNHKFYHHEFEGMTVDISVGQQVACSISDTGSLCCYDMKNEV